MAHDLLYLLPLVLELVLMLNGTKGCMVCSLRTTRFNKLLNVLGLCETDITMLYRQKNEISKR